MSLFVYAMRRILSAIPVLLGVSIGVFLMLHLAPGDPAVIVAGADAPPETVAAVRSELGLDRPLYEQYWMYLKRLLQGDLGRSIRSREPVVELLAQTFPNTLALAVGGTAVAVSVSIPLGVVSAVRRNSWVDNLSRFLALLGASVPIFAVGLALMWVFGYWLRLFPLSGNGGSVLSWQGLWHLVLPAVSVSFYTLAVLTRLTRSSMLEAVKQDYVRTARAKGLSEVVVVYRHALRNALLPVVTLAGIQFGHLLAGAVVTETIFAWPGMGRLAVAAILSRDFPVVQGVILVISIMFVLINLAVDIVYAVIDPRIRYG